MAEYEYQSTDSCPLKTTTQKLRAIIEEFTRKNISIPADILAEIKVLRNENAKRNHGGWKLIRNLAAKLAGDIDTFVK